MLAVPVRIIVDRVRMLIRLVRELEQPRARLAVMVMSNSDSPNAGIDDGMVADAAAICSPPTFNSTCSPRTGSARHWDFEC